jgi:hypothetical protein
LQSLAAWPLLTMAGSPPASEVLELPRSAHATLLCCHATCLHRLRAAAAICMRSPATACCIQQCRPGAVMQHASRPCSTVRWACWAYPVVLLCSMPSSHVARRNTAPVPVCKAAGADHATQHGVIQLICSSALVPMKAPVRHTTEAWYSPCASCRQPWQRAAAVQHAPVHP